MRRGARRARNTLQPLDRLNDQQKREIVLLYRGGMDANRLAVRYNLRGPETVLALSDGRLH